MPSAEPASLNVRWTADDSVVTAASMISPVRLMEPIDAVALATADFLLVRHGSLLSLLRGPAYASAASSRGTLRSGATPTRQHSRQAGALVVREAALDLAADLCSLPSPRLSPSSTSTSPWGTSERLDRIIEQKRAGTLAGIALLQELEELTSQAVDVVQWSVVEHRPT